VLPLAEAASHPHMAARGVYADVEGAVQVAPAPRFSRTPGAVQPTRSADAMIAGWRAAR